MTPTSLSSPSQSYSYSEVDASHLIPRTIWCHIKMSDKKYHSSQPSLKHFGGGCVSGLCGTWKHNRKETDEMNTMNNCSATHLSHLNVHIQNENKHHNFDQAFESSATWRQALLWLYPAKIKILFDLICIFHCQGRLATKLKEIFSQHY